MKPGDQFRLGFRQIERCTIGLGDTANEKEYESDGLQEDVPEARVFLRLDDLHQAEASREHQHTDNRKTQRDLVTDHLSRGTQRPKQRVLAVRSPSPEDDSQDADR